MNRLSLSLCSVSWVLLTACVSTPTSVVVRDIDQAKIIKPEQRPDIQNTIPANQAPIYQESAPRALPIVEQLFNKSAEAIEARQWEQAITLAEKGLRIERKEARFYWVLASAYAQLSDGKQSQSFAKQGLRYADKNSPLARKLTHYLP